MSSLPSNVALLSKAVRVYFSYPLLFLALQIPAASVSVVGDFLPVDRPGMLLASLAVIFPYFCIASFLSSALTFNVARRIERQLPITLMGGVRETLPYLNRLVPVSFLAGLISVLGIAALVLPSLYFMTVYFFVPLLVVSEDRLPWSVYLWRSKNLARGRFFRVFMLMLTIFLISGAVELLPYGDISAAQISQLLGYSIRFAVSAAISGITNLWVSYFFLSLRPQPL